MRSFQPRLARAALALVLVPVTAVGVIQGADAAPAVQPRTLTVLDIAAAENLNTLRTVLTPDLFEALSDPGAGPFTLFAPTDAAFAALPPSDLAFLLDNPALLTDVLEYHVVSSRAFAADLKGRITTLNGATVRVAKTPAGIRVNGVDVVLSDLLASNGVVHVIDRVLFPDDSSCGSSWIEAMFSCNMACPLRNECPPGQTCHVGTNCNYPLEDIVSRQVVTLEGEFPGDATMDANAQGLFSGVMLDLLSSMDRTYRVALDDAEVTDQAVFKSRRRLQRPGVARAPAALDVSLSVKGRYRPPPDQNFDLPVQDAINGFSRRLVKELQARGRRGRATTDFFEGLRGLTAVREVAYTPRPTPRPAPRPTPRPPASSKSKSKASKASRKWDTSTSWHQWEKSPKSSKRGHRYRNHEKASKSAKSSKSSKSSESTKNYLLGKYDVRRKQGRRGRGPRNVFW